MKHQSTNNTQRNLLAAAANLLLFLLWTAAVKCIDVKPLGPNGSTVGFAALNGFIHDLTGVHRSLYVLTDWLGLVPIAFMFGFAVLGLCQWIGRKSLFRVDRSLLVLGGYYVLVLAAYLFFESFVINYRPVLIDGFLEASYPSSTTLLVLCVMPTAVWQLRRRIRNAALRKTLCAVLTAFTVLMVVGRLISGVHWFTDIVGGLLLGVSFVKLYEALAA